MCLWTYEDCEDCISKLQLTKSVFESTWDAHIRIGPDIRSLKVFRKIKFVIVGGRTQKLWKFFLRVQDVSESRGRVDKEVDKLDFGVLSNLVYPGNSGALYVFVYENI